MKGTLCNLSDKELVTRKYKELSNVNNKETTKFKECNWKYRYRFKQILHQRRYLNGY